MGCSLCSERERVVEREMGDYEECVTYCGSAMLVTLAYSFMEDKENECVQNKSSLMKFS